MNDAYRRLVAGVAREGARLHAAWDSGRFDRLCEGPARTLWDRLAARPHGSDEAAFSAYLTLLREAVGSQYLGRAGIAAGDGHGLVSWACFLEFCLLKLVPEALADEPAEDRVGLLATAWNIGEGLLGEPAWLDRFVVASATELRHVAAIEPFVLRVLEPVLEPSAPATWDGPFGLLVLDTRAAHDPFLPGEMHLAAPAVLCVRDRRDPGIHLNILLRHGARSRVLGLSPPLDGYAEERPAPEVAFADGRVRIGQHQVDLPLLGEPYRMATAGSGFVVASAPDSQRLWIVESP
jgi:hypothetical protein